MSGHDNVFYTNEIRAYNAPRLQNSKPTTTWYPSENYPLGLTIFDYNCKRDITIKSYFDNVKYNDANKAFDTTIHLDAWRDTEMFGQACTWVDNFKHDRDFQHGKVTLKPDQLTQGVSFPTEFTSGPNVIVWLSGFDVSHTGEFRFSVNATDITTKGFQLLGSIWGTTKLNSLDATWIAYPASRPNIDSGFFDTMEVRDWQKPVNETSKKVEFQKNFQRPPRVFFAISKIDVFHNDQKNLRLKAYITDTTTKGLTAHLDSWCDNNVYSAQGQWLAVQDY